MAIKICFGATAASLALPSASLINETFIVVKHPRWKSAGNLVDFLN
jgi:hypothetical protein